MKSGQELKLEVKQVDSLKVYGRAKYVIPGFHSFTYEDTKQSIAENTKEIKKKRLNVPLTIVAVVVVPLGIFTGIAICISNNMSFDLKLP